MMDELNRPIQHIPELAAGWIKRDGFVFGPGDEPDVFNSLLIRYPNHAECHEPWLGDSSLSLDDHIHLINHCQLTHATFVCNDLTPLRHCPTLTHLRIYPARNLPGELDFSPLYDHPQVYSLLIDTMDFKADDPLSTQVRWPDYARVRGLRCLTTLGARERGIEHVTGLTALHMKNRKRMSDLTGLQKLTSLKQLSFTNCKIRSLNGLEAFHELESLNLSDCRQLSDISALSTIAPRLKKLSIEDCPKIRKHPLLQELSIV